MSKRQFAACLICYAIVFVPLCLMIAACVASDTQVAHVLALIDSAKG